MGGRGIREVDFKEKPRKGLRKMLRKRVLDFGGLQDASRVWQSNGRPVG